MRGMVRAFGVLQELRRGVAGRFCCGWFFHCGRTSSTRSSSKTPPGRQAASSAAAIAASTAACACRRGVTVSEIVRLKSVRAAMISTPSRGARRILQRRDGVDPAAHCPLWMAGRHMRTSIVVSSANHRRIARGRIWLGAGAPAEEVVIVGTTLDAANELARIVARTKGAAFGIIG
jgi:hypothetical protein